MVGVLTADLVSNAAPWWDVFQLELRVAAGYRDSLREQETDSGVRASRSRNTPGLGGRTWAELSRDLFEITGSH